MSVATGYGKEPEPSTSSSVQWSQQCRHFEFPEILLATENFNESLVIGRGGFGKVYRGTIFSGSTTVIAAIKRLDSSSNQGAPEFWAEVEMLSKLRHCHLVSLFGYCNLEKEMILVYEYMPNGTLEHHLHKIGTPLSWVQRLKICIGAGRGLHYLHTGTGIDVGVIHRDVKTSNILLQESWAAKISDFGLSKIGPTNQTMTHVSTLVRGTFGYFDPEYYATGKLTRKSDVYAFGVVLLEVLCRKRAVFDIDEEAFNLAIWAQESIKEGNLKNIIDPDLMGQISSKSLKEFVRITKGCLHSSPKQRSTMEEVLFSLESILDLQEKFNNSVPAGRTILDRMINMLPFPSNGENTVGFKKELLWFGEDLQKLLKRFSLRELQVATDNFSNTHILGRGGFGKVYKGRLADGTVVAIKRLKEEKGGELQFQTEVKMISLPVHRNLLRLRGLCMTPTEWLLVYPYMANGSVASWLRDRPETQVPLDWQKRKRIALGSATGLACLHDHCDPQIIHRDVKAANILLDEEFEAVVCDFGLAKFMDNKDTHVTTAVRGTIGHIAPEYLSTGKASPKIDVFGYGVMLLELITGQRAFDRLANEDDVNLLDWVKWNLMARRLETIVDADLKGSYIDDEVEQLIQVALLCTGGTPLERPKMSEVIRMLEGDGLAERWEEWQKFNTAHNPNADWIIVDSIYNLSPEELSGPR